MADLPGAPPNFTAIPSGTKQGTAIGGLTHREKHNKIEEEFEELVAMVGTGATGATPTAGTVRVGTGAGTAAWVSGGPVPVGSLLDFAGPSAPNGWLLCYGQTVSRTTYAALFAVLGTTYNTGGEAGTDFRLPDLRGRVTAGKDNMGGSAANRLTSGGSGITGTTLGAAGGTQTHTLATSEMPAHTHPPLTGGHAFMVTQSTVPSQAAGASVSPNALDATTGSTGGGGAHQNTQPTLILNRIIFAGV